MDAKRSRSWLATRTDANSADWPGMVAEGNYLLDLPFEPRELVEELCLNILEQACAGSER